MADGENKSLNQEFLFFNKILEVQSKSIQAQRDIVAQMSSQNDHIKEVKDNQELIRKDIKESTNSIVNSIYAPLVKRLTWLVILLSGIQIGQEVGIIDKFFSLF